MAPPTGALNTTNYTLYDVHETINGRNSLMVQILALGSLTQLQASAAGGNPFQPRTYVGDYAPEFLSSSAQSDIVGDPGESGGLRPTYQSIIQQLPDHPGKLGNTWSDITHPAQRANTNSREFLHTETNLRVRFDEGTPGASGFEGVNHWHIYNPSAQSRHDTYLDFNGNPVGRGSNASHILAR